MYLVSRQIRISKILVALALFSLLSSGIFAAGSARSLSAGSHDPISITKDTDFTPAGASGGCKCVREGDGGPHPFIIGPWSIMANSKMPGVHIDGSGGITKSFVLYHVSVHGTGETNGIELFNLNGMGADAIQAANVDGALNGIALSQTTGVTITGNSVNNNQEWGIKLDHSDGNTITFMTLARNGLKNPDTKLGNPESISVFLQKTIWGGVLFSHSNHNTLQRSELSEDGYAGFVLIGSDFNNITEVHSRYPDYYGGVLQDSSNNRLVNISMQTGDFSGLIVRSGGSNTIMNSTFSANGPIGNEEKGQIVPYYISGLYLGWGTHDNKIKLNHSNNGDTGPGLLLDNGQVKNPIQSPMQTANPFNVRTGMNAGNDLGTVPTESQYDAGIPTAAGAGNVICGNTFTSFAGVSSANGPC